MNIAFAYNVKKSDPLKGELFATDLDFDSQENIDDIKNNIKSLGHKVICIEADFDALEKLRKNKKNIDLLFNIAEGLGGDARESQIPLFCEMLGIPYTHSSPTTHAIALDKEFTKMVVKSAGVRVPESIRIDSIEFDEPKLRYPLILKPNFEGSGVGIVSENIVEDFKSLISRVKKIFKDGYNKTMLAEEYIEGREFTVGVLDNYPGRVLPILEQRFDFLPKTVRNISGIELKWIYEEQLKNIDDAYVCPAKLPKEKENELKKITLTAYDALRCLDTARLDYRMDSQGNFYFLEVNPLPGIIQDPNILSYLPAIARKVGIDSRGLIKNIIESACQRFNIH